METKGYLHVGFYVHLNDFLSPFVHGKRDRQERVEPRYDSKTGQRIADEKIDPLPAKLIVKYRDDVVEFEITADEQPIDTDELHSFISRVSKDNGFKTECIGVDRDEEECGADTRLLYITLPGKQIPFDENYPDKAPRLEAVAKLVPKLRKLKTHLKTLGLNVREPKIFFEASDDLERDA